MLVVETLNLDTFAAITETLDSVSDMNPHGAALVTGISPIAGRCSLTVCLVSGEVIASSERGFHSHFDTLVVRDAWRVDAKASGESADGETDEEGDDLAADLDAYLERPLELPEITIELPEIVVDLDAINNKDDDATRERFRLSLAETVRAFTSVPADILSQQ